DEISFSRLQDALALTEQVHPTFRDDYVGDNERFYTLCEQWPTFSPAADQNLPVVSPIPTLVLSGEFDPITPPNWGRMVANDLPNSQFFVLAGVGHGVARSNDCGMALVLAFLDNPTVP